MQDIDTNINNQQPQFQLIDPRKVKKENILLKDKDKKDRLNICFTDPEFITSYKALSNYGINCKELFIFVINSRYEELQKRGVVK